MLPNRIEKGFDAYTEWRQKMFTSIEAFREWLKEQKLSDVQTDERLDHVLSTINDDKLHVAFVAEFSRGKSELINATFFGQLGKRVLPSSAGRTTMCPTELLYNKDEVPSIKLLPIETRENSTTIFEYKGFAEEWETKTFDPENPDDVRDVLALVTDTIDVRVDQAKAMGLPVAEDTDDPEGIRPDENGRVEIPKWRHAIINFPHPLLEQGLVILDTPGLNALGAEPELTLNMLGMAHAVIFILAADAGVTKSDMSVWRDHIMVKERSSDKGKLVVLNKVDVLWDELRDHSEVQAEIDKQVQDTADMLEVDLDNIFPLSAQKALLGKIKDDSDLVKQSGISKLEDALTNLLIPAKIDIVRANVRGEMSDVTNAVNAMVGQRLKDVNDHMAELDQLNTKNLQVIEDMMEKVRSDKEHLEKNLQRFQATRSIFSQQTSKLYSHLSLANLERIIAETKRDMELSLTTSGLRSRMVTFFDEVSSCLDAGTNQAAEIEDLMAGVYKKFQEEHGLANIKPRSFSTAKYIRELRRLEEKHEHFTRGMSMVMTEQTTLVEKFFETVVVRVRQVFEKANRDADTWLKTIMSPMESQVREHQIQLRRRLESIKRIHKASDTLEDRVAEIQHVRGGIVEQQGALNGLVGDVESHLTDDQEKMIDDEDQAKAS